MKIRQELGRLELGKLEVYDAQGLGIRNLPTLDNIYCDINVLAHEVDHPYYLNDTDNLVITTNIFPVCLTDFFGRPYPDLELTSVEKGDIASIISQRILKEIAIIKLSMPDKYITMRDVEYLYTIDMPLQSKYKILTFKMSSYGISSHSIESNQDN